MLLTGFGPFPTVPTNASALLVPELAVRGAAAFPGYHFHAEVLATEWRAGPDRAARLLHQLQPTLALHFGVSSRARGIVIETLAVNVAAPAADATGALPETECLERRGADAVGVGFPARYIAERLRAHAIPVELSRSAGTYLCNAVLYRSCALAAAPTANWRSGFVHLPTSLVDSHRGLPRPRPGCPLDWDQVMIASLEIIAASLGRPAVRSWLQG